MKSVYIIKYKSNRTTAMMIAEAMKRDLKNSVLVEGAEAYQKAFQDEYIYSIILFGGTLWKTLRVFGPAEIITIKIN